MKATGNQGKTGDGGPEPLRPRAVPAASLLRRLSLAAFCLLTALPARGAETLTLAECLRETAMSNPEVVQEQFAIQQAYGQRLVFRSRALPTLSFAVLAGYQGAQTNEVIRGGRDANGQRLPNVTSARGSTAILTTGGELSQPIFDAAIPASWRLGTLGVAAAQQNLYATATAALYRARLSFARALYYQQRDELLRLTDQNLQGNLKAQNLLVGAGLGTRQAVLAAQVQRANFNPVLTGNAGTYRSTLADLFQIMGRHLPASAKGDPLDGVALAGPLEDTPLEFDPAAAAKEALAERPDLQALRTAVKTYAENANVARAGYYPTIKIYLAGQYLPQSYIQSQNSSSRASDRVQTSELRPGVRGEWAIIDTGSVLGQTRTLDATREVLAQSLRKLEEAIPSDLANLRGQADAAREAVRVLQANIATAQDTLNIVNAGIAQGVNSQLEFLEAQGGVFQTRLGLLESQLALAQTHAEYDRITGRYLRFVTPPRSPAKPTTAK